MNKMYYEYLKNHAYVSYNKKSTYDFELSKERAECMANKYNSSTCELQKENQELKKQLHDASIQIQELIEKDIWCPSNCEKLEKLEQENKKIKKQLETYEIEGYKQEEELDKMSFDIRKYKTQQKEFIKWLEDYLNLFDYRDIQEQAGYDMLEEILQKYREIIGASDEKK